LDKPHHPEFQGEGLGTALLLTRLALLRPARRYLRVFMFAVNQSIGFYRRFGFVPFTPWKDKNGDTHPSGVLGLFFNEILTCRKLLAAHSITFPADQDFIPVYQEHGKLPSGQDSVP
jgi:hypothetical protein